ncbi:MAG: hypothetical protein HZA69_03860 [Gammaproteobacteria bacterium]|nr:hypothetical protein [Gammaproteobacteria bacterium]
MSTKFMILAVGLTFLLGTAHAALARGGAGAGGAPGGHGGEAGGMSSGHISEAGQSNTNAQFLPDSQRGLDRAETRMNEQGLEHEQATKPHKQQGKSKGKSKNNNKPKTDTKG